MIIKQGFTLPIVGSHGVWQIAYSSVSKFKSVVPGLFNGSEVLSPESSETK